MRALALRIQTFVKSKTGRLLEHYVIVFAGAAAASLLASAEHFAGVRGVHALAAVAVGVGAAALKAGYDAVRQLAVPAIAAWLAARKITPAK